MAFLQELQRRKVIRAAAMYLVAAWLLIQVADIIGPILALPEWFDKLVLALLFLGFPIALVLAWSFELTPDGVAAESSPVSSQSTRRVDYALLIILLLAVVGFAMNQLTTTDNNEPAHLDASVAVLPFVNINADEENAAFTSGIHTDLLTQLARIDSVRTVSRTTVLKFRDSTMTIPDIGKTLDVATVVEGGVQRSGDTVRINIQLIDAATDQALWAEVFERDLTAANIFSIQSQIARAIAGQLRVSLSPDDQQRLESTPTQSLDALDAYFTGKVLIEKRTQKSLHEAVNYFEEAVNHDPDFALGWSGLADAFMLLPEYSYDIDRDMVTRRSRQALLRALDLDPSLPEVRSTEAWYQLTRNYDWKGAEAIFAESLEKFPDNTNLLHWMSHTLSWQGRQEEGLALAGRAVAVEPDSQLMLMNLAYILTDAGHFEEALSVAARVIEEAPAYLSLRRNFFLHQLRAGKIKSGGDAFAIFISLNGGNQSIAREIADMFIAYADHGAVGEITPEMIEGAQLGSEDLAQVFAMVGDSESALKAIDDAIEERAGSRSALSAKINPAYDFFRDDPRFDPLLRKLGLLSVEM